MITSVRIESLRGIRTGLVEGLTELSVLVGPNNSGKSTVLDALLIGAHPVPRDAIAHVVRRRATVERGVRWLFWRSGNHASVAVKTSAGAERKCTLQRQRSEIGVSVTGPSGTTREDVVGLDASNNVIGGIRTPTGQLDDVVAIDLVEPHRGADQEPLHRVFTRAQE